MNHNLDNLLETARQAATHAYAPYSNFRVGAALLTADGRVYSGCNIENASYGLTICAERVAVFKAVADGVTAFAALAIAGGTTAAPATPCGACRQVLVEFAPPEMPVIFGALEGGIPVVTDLARLLPHSFSLAAQISPSK